MFENQWKLLLAPVGLCGFLALLYLLVAPSRYQATARVMVLQQGGRPVNLANNDTGRPMEGADDYMATQAAIIRSPVVVQGAIDAVGLENLPTLRHSGARSPAENAIQNNLTVTQPERLAKVLRLDYRAKSRDEAVRMLDAITASYRKFLEQDYPRNSEIIALIRNAQKEAAADLETAEKQYLAFRQHSPLLVADEKGRSLITSRLERWDTAINQAKVREVHTKAQLSLARRVAESGGGFSALVYAMSQLSGDASNGLSLYAGNGGQPASWDYLRQLSQEQQQLADRYGPQNAKVQELQDQMSRIQERIRSSRNRNDQPDLADLIQSLEQSVEVSGSMRAELTQGFDRDKELERDFLLERDLRQTLERRRALFNAVVDQLKQAQLASAYSPVAVHVLGQPSAFPHVVEPRWGTTLAVALIVGLLAGIGLVRLRLEVETRMSSAEELHKQSLRHLEAI